MSVVIQPCEEYSLGVHRGYYTGATIAGPFVN